MQTEQGKHISETHSYTGIKISWKQHNKSNETCMQRTTLISTLRRRQTLCPTNIETTNVQENEHYVHEGRSVVVVAVAGHGCWSRKRTTTQVMLSALPLCVASTRSFLAASCESTIGFTVATASWNGEQLQNNAFGSEVEK
jgi:hypothetical protein